MVTQENAGNEIVRWADTQQFKQEAMPEEVREKGFKVTILSATSDPLGVLAAITALYSGKVVRDLSEVSYLERRKAFEDMTNTALNSALESVNFVILFEGVNRSFTHQHVRGRNAMYVQESLRFAVPEDWAADVPLPPSLAADPNGAKARIFRKTLNTIEDAYAALVNDGMPAEEARDLLPHGIQTRIHWVVSLRELLHVAGLRTCTQAQFIWRMVFADVAKALREHGKKQPRWEMPVLDYQDRLAGVSDDWQFDLLANSLRPVCYQTGSCQFEASFDRDCTIRERVQANVRIGRKPKDWGSPGYASVGDNREQLQVVDPIQDWEWAADPAAARRTGAGTGCVLCGGRGCVACVEFVPTKQQPEDGAV